MSISFLGISFYSIQFFILAVEEVGLESTSVVEPQCLAITETTYSREDPTLDL